MDYYRNLSEHYEQLQPREEIFRQESFFKALIEKYSIKTCLDCACGTGWHLHMLNRLGLKCDGSDISDSMLEKARENLKGLPVTIKKEDFKTLTKSWTTKYDMVICMSTSFPHNAGDSEAIQTLNSMYDCLNKGGIVVIDNGYSDLFFTAKPKFIPARVYQDQAFYFFIEYPDPEKIIFNILHVMKNPGGFDHSFEAIEYIAIGKDRFDRIFDSTEFSRVDYFGDYDLSKYSTETSKRMIVIGEK